MKIKFLLPIILLTLFLTACDSNNAIPISAPFSDASWENNLDKICELEGTEYEKTLSMSGGYNYIFPKNYLGYDGYVQYNINDAGKLDGISWFSISNDSNLTSEIYEAIQKQTTTDLGAPSPLGSSNIHSGAQWETDSNTVMLVSLAQEGEYAIQITYLLKDK